MKTYTPDELGETPIDWFEHPELLLHNIKMAVRLMNHPSALDARAWEGALKTEEEARASYDALVMGPEKETK